MATKKETRKQNALQRFGRETMGELRKVSWPARQEAINLTIIVIIVMVFMSILLSITDIISGRLLDLLLGI